MHESSTIFPIITDSNSLFEYLVTTRGYMYKHSLGSLSDPTASLDLMFDAVDSRRAPWMSVEFRRNIKRNIEGSNDFWRIREFERFIEHPNIAHYMPVLLPNFPTLYKADATKDHFLHLSIQAPGYVSYTASPVLGQQDRQIRTTFGRYVKKFFPQYTDHEIRDIVSMYKSKYADLDIKWARTAEEMEHVYTHGPRSCMSYHTNYGGFGSHVHPSHAYVGPDIALAYLVHDKTNAINARCLTYKKRYIRNYGDDALLIMLRQSGYVPGNLDGAKITKIPAMHHCTDEPLPNTYVVPYIDDLMGGGNTAQGVKLIPDDSEHLQVCALGDPDCIPGALSTSGLAGQFSRLTRNDSGDNDDDDNDNDNEDDRSCYDCEDTYNMDDMNLLDYMDRWVCHSCLDDRYIEAFVGSQRVEFVGSESCIDILDSDGNEQNVYVYDNAMSIPEGLHLITYPDRFYINAADVVTIQVGMHEHCDTHKAFSIELMDKRISTVDSCVDVTFKNKPVYLSTALDEFPNWVKHIFVSTTTNKITYRSDKATKNQFIETWLFIIDNDLMDYTYLSEVLRRKGATSNDIQESNYFWQKNLALYYDNSEAFNNHNYENPEAFVDASHVISFDLPGTIEDDVSHVISGTLASAIEDDVSLVINFDLTAALLNYAINDPYESTVEESAQVVDDAQVVQTT